MADAMRFLYVFETFYYVCSTVNKMNGAVSSGLVRTLSVASSSVPVLMLERLANDEVERIMKREYVA